MTQTVIDLAVVVHELAAEYRTVDDAGQIHSREPLLARLDELVMPGRRSSSGSDTLRGARVVGSPAPWSAAAGELVATIEHEAVRTARYVRDTIGYGPLLVTLDIGGRPRTVPAPYVAARPAALAALVDLPDRLEVLAQDLPEEAAQIAGRFRHLHHQALLLLGEAATSWTHLHRMENLYRVPDARFRLAGPACQVTCRHESCAARRLERAAMAPIRCPHCGCRSLMLHREHAVIQCANPVCRDTEGNRHTWSLRELEQVLIIDPDTSWTPQSSMMPLPAIGGRR